MSIKLTSPAPAHKPNPTERLRGHHCVQEPHWPRTTTTGHDQVGLAPQQRQVVRNAPCGDGIAGVGVGGASRDVVTPEERRGRVRGPSVPSSGTGGQGLRHWLRDDVISQPCLRCMRASPVTSPAPPTNIPPSRRHRSRGVEDTQLVLDVRGRRWPRPPRAGQEARGADLAGQVLRPGARCAWQDGRYEPVRKSTGVRHLQAMLSSPAGVRE